MTAVYEPFLPDADRPSGQFQTGLGQPAHGVVTYGRPAQLDDMPKHDGARGNADRLSEAKADNLPRLLIPAELEPLMAKWRDLQDRALLASEEADRLRQQHRAAQGADIRATEDALATGKSLPKATSTKYPALIEEADRIAEAQTNLALAASNKLIAAAGSSWPTWRAETIAAYDLAVERALQLADMLAAASDEVETLMGAAFRLDDLLGRTWLQKHPNGSRALLAPEEVQGINPVVLLQQQRDNTGWNGANRLHHIQEVRSFIQTKRPASFLFDPRTLPEADTTDDTAA